VEIDLYQVDAFASERFSGNPAAVCPLAAWLPDAILRAIAAENNLSETAFVVTGEGCFELRWFTPACEVELCGHATLATAYVISTWLDPGRERFVFHTRYSGVLEVVRTGDLFTMDFPAQPATRIEDSRALEAAVGGPVCEAWVAVKTLAVLGDAAAVRNARPVLDQIGDLPGDGLILTARGSDVDFVARYFAPHRGVPEDPVTGSAYCSLTPYWSERLGKRRMVARQLSRRGGMVEVEHRGDRVAISGRAVPYLVGRIDVPAA